MQLRLLPRPRGASPLSTAALLENVGGTARLRRAWRWLRGKQAEPTLCEKLLEPTS